MPGSRHVIEVDHHQERKHHQAACGDVFHSVKIEGGRVLSVLADGLGSGIKANVLANLTATMAARYVAADVDITRAAKTIMETLPVCSERQIAYSTFSIVDMDRRGETRIVEFDTPPFVLLRDGRAVEVEKEAIHLHTASGRPATLYHSRFTVQPGDRVVVFSDGVSQAGVGSRGFPLGWGRDSAQTFLEGVLRERPTLSARQMARTLVNKALFHDGHSAKDDISCGVIYYRKPREVIVLTGPPVLKERDRAMAEEARDFEGRKVICGGSTAKLVARELGLPLEMDMEELDPHVPPASRMKGFDLVTEGAITLSILARMLEEEESPELLKPNAATRLAGVLLDSDIIHFLVGTKINEALQDPNLPEDLDIRRNLMRRLQRILSTRFLKEVTVRFI